MHNTIYEECVKWINENEFGNYKGSIRSLVRWFVLTDRRFEYASKKDVDEVTKLLISYQGYDKVKEVSKYDSVLNCKACGKSLITHDNLCEDCLNISRELC